MLIDAEVILVKFLRAHNCISSCGMKTVEINQSELVASRLVAAFVRLRVL